MEFWSTTGAGSALTGCEGRSFTLGKLRADRNSCLPECLRPWALQDKPSSSNCGNDSPSVQYGRVRVARVGDDPEAISLIPEPADGWTSAAARGLPLIPSIHRMNKRVTERTEEERMVGARGFEPPASWSRTRRASQAALRPDSTHSDRRRGRMEHTE